MSMKPPNADDLTVDERAVVGMPGDLVSGDSVPARAPSTTVVISLRLDRHVFDRLNQLAQEDGRTFSETARDALRNLVEAHGAHGDSYPLREHNARPVRKVSEAIHVTWNDDELQNEVERYAAACQRAGIRESASRSYVDYARRFLAWRTGDYRPRGVGESDRPVPRSGASTADLRHQAAEYAQRVRDAGREQPTVDTYYRHATFFIRWLEGEFQPGARLRGLR